MIEISHEVDFEYTPSYQASLSINSQIHVLILILVPQDMRLECDLNDAQRTY